MTHNRHCHLDRRLSFTLAACICASALPVVALAGDLPDVGRADFPNDDAVILRRMQHWTLESDGTVVHEEHRWVKLLNDRAWRRHADPRVDYLPGAEEVQLIVARAHTPDGRTLDSPDYAINEVTPAGVSKWPTLTAWRQACYTFSGVGNDAVLELHYKRTSKPGARRWLEADLRIGDLDPVAERVVAVTVPQGTELRYSLERIDDRHAKFEKTQTNGTTTYRWTLSNVASDADEPRCPPWRERCGRLRFTNCPSAQAWVEDILASIEQSADAHERVTEFAIEAAKDEVDDAGKVRAIAKKLHDTFNFVNDWRGWVGRSARTSGEVFDGCYGSRLEAAGLALAALRAVGMEARATIAIEHGQYDPEVATDSALAAVVIEVAAAGGPILIEPESGVINRNGAWRDRDLLYLDGGSLQRLALAAENSRPDTVQVRGRLILDDNAEELTGELTIHLSGLFVNPEKLRTDGQKKKRVQSIVDHIVGGLKVTDLSVSQLSRDELTAQVSVESGDALEKVYDRRVLALAVETPALAEGHLPLGPSKRRTPIQLPGRLTDDIQLHIQLPNGWKVAILPRAVDAVTADWGRIVQTVEGHEGGDQSHWWVTITRQVGFNVLTIDPSDYPAIRDAVRALRGDGARMLVIEKVAD